MAGFPVQDHLFVVESEDVERGWGATTAREYAVRLADGKDVRIGCAFFRAETAERVIQSSPDGGKYPYRVVKYVREDAPVNMAVEQFEASKLRDLERSLAYENASGVIESCCTMVAEDGCMKFYDVRSADVDLTDEVKYLQSRRLLDLHPEHSHWVSVRDESEPLPEGQGGY